MMKKSILRWVNLPALILLLYSINTAHAVSTTINWSLQGNNLHYTITSAYNNTTDEIIDCATAIGGCFIQMGIGHDPFKNILWKDYVNTLKGKQSPKRIAEEWSAARLPKSGVINNWPQWISKNPCIVLYIGSDYRGSAFLGDSCSGTMTPPPTEPPPPPLSCSISGNGIVLPHGSLDQNVLNGNTKSVTVMISCTKTATVRITAKAGNGTDTVTLRSDGSLKSRLQVNGIAGTTGATVSVPGTSGTYVQFSSTLITNGTVAAGAFYGTAVAVVTII
ncbi:TPA: hypothetical protein ACXJQO_004522 [Serratia marcescens]